MKKPFFLFALMVASIIGAQSVFAEQTVYTSYNSSTKTLTYYYDEYFGNTTDRPNSVAYEPSSSAQRWAGYYSQVKTIVIDESMQNAPLTSMRYMFFSGNSNQTLSNVTSITGLDNLNTADVTNMTAMFEGLKRLTSLDVSNFNTAKVIYMGQMFENCSALTSLNLSNFNTSNVITMSQMFEQCSALTSLDITKFCFDKVTNTSCMFGYCTNLTTIYCNSDWNASTKLTSSTNMFMESPKLKGGYNTAYNSSKIDKTYARPDKTGQAGYFTKKAVIFAELSISGTIMYIRYRDDIEPKNMYLEWNADGTGTNNMTTEAKEKITTVEFNSTMANARPTTCARWFDDLTNLTAINNINYLNTSEATSMFCMFSTCRNLSALNVSGFNTGKVTNMQSVFYGCSKLTSINVSNFNTEKVTNMSRMFCLCSKLTAINLSNFNTKKVSTMKYMFYKCTSLTKLDLCNFDITNLSNTEYMFQYCSALETIWCNQDWSASDKITYSNYMFSGCTSLKGGKNTTYNSSNVDKTYACVDHSTKQPGYFTADKDVFTLRDNNVLYYYYSDQFNSNNSYMEEYDPIAYPDRNRWANYAGSITEVVIDATMKDAPLTSMRRMFNGGNNRLTALTKITGLENLNTAIVTDMRYLFEGCTALTTLDLTSFDISNLMYTTYMFRDCSNLQTINCDDNWNDSEKLFASESMFAGCNKLKGGNGTAFNSSRLNKVYARPDKAGQAGYFTSQKALLADARAALKERIDDMQALYDFAAQYVDESDLAAFKNTINSFKETYNDPNATLSDVKSAVGVADIMLSYTIEQIIPAGQIALKEMFEDKLPQNADEAARRVVKDAQDKVDALAWDENKTVAENIAILEPAILKIIQDVDEALAVTGIEEIETDKVQGTKFIHNGQLYLLRNGKIYTPTGTEVK